MKSLFLIFSLCFILIQHHFAQNNLKAIDCSIYNNSPNIDTFINAKFIYRELFYSCSWSKCQTNLSIDRKQFIKHTVNSKDKNSVEMSSFDSSMFYSHTHLQFLPDSIREINIDFQFAAFDWKMQSFENNTDSAKTVNEIIKSSKKEKEMKLNGLLFINGDIRSREDYAQYSRIKDIKIYFDNKYIGSAQLKDTPILQWIPLKKNYRFKWYKPKRLTVEVCSTYPGISKDIVFTIDYEGKNGHSRIEELVKGKKIKIF